MPRLFRSSQLVRLGCLLLLSCCALAQAAGPLRLTVPPFLYNDRPETVYFYKLLELALRKTEQTDGPFSIGTYPAPISPERAIEEIKKNGAINLMWNGTSPSRERDLLAVRFSLIRELNNYRLFLIRKEDQAKFDQVKNLDDLRRLSAGSGLQWPDTAILRENGLPVVTTMHYEALFPMLALKRFDYFPRGIYEVFGEADVHAKEGLVIEKTLMIHYDLPFYFFVNKGNTALADRLERGLNKALADGSFDQLMLGVPRFKRGLEEQRNAKRKLFMLRSQFQSP
jgi:ABC-type amino acid transport substrate-binding protein